MQKINQSIATLAKLAEQVSQMDDEIDQAAELLAECFRDGHKILVCGNGGSGTDAQHLTEELITKYYLKNRALPAIALSADTASLTAIGNDYGFEDVFAMQVEALGLEKDVLVVFSTSGRSANIIRAVKVARDRGLKVLAFLGKSADQVFDDCEVCLKVPSTDTPRIQEIHTSLLHAVGEKLSIKIT